MSHKNKKKSDPFDAITKNVVSSTECTGLFQGLPEDEEQMEAYDDIIETP